MGELIVVDDDSTVKSVSVIYSLEDPRLVAVQQPVNQGKGAAPREGFARAIARFIAVHGADHEYDPRDLERLCSPLRDGRAGVVHGSRFMRGREHRVPYYWPSIGIRILATPSNVATDANLTGMETCSRVFAREIIQNLHLWEGRFSFERGHRQARAL